MSLVLFDIDGTLLLTGGAGIRAMSQAFEAVFGVSEAFAGIPAGGRTDTYLVSRALERAGLEDDPDPHAAFVAAYLPRLAVEIHRSGSGRRGLMPGVTPLLDALAAAPDYHLALLTGNYSAAARIKLGYFGIDHYFAWGIFGEESADRNELGRLAQPRARAHGVPPKARDMAVVVGDTPHDVECARAGGLRSLGVATGSHSVDDLRLAGADAVLADLSETATVLDALLGRA